MKSLCMACKGKRDRRWNMVALGTLEPNVDDKKAMRACLKCVAWLQLNQAAHPSIASMRINMAYWELGQLGLANAKVSWHIWHCFHVTSGLASKWPAANGLSLKRVQNWIPTSEAFSRGATLSRKSTFRFTNCSMSRHTSTRRFKTSSIKKARQLASPPGISVPNSAEWYQHSKFQTDTPPARAPKISRTLFKARWSGPLNHVFSRSNFKQPSNVKRQSI